MKSRQARQYLNSFINYELRLDRMNYSSFKLDRVKQLLKSLGNPQECMKIIHVAGSKGKGSTCALIANILKSSGYKVGLFTSPHITDIRERIRVLGGESIKKISDTIFSDTVSEEEFSDCILEIRPQIEQIEAEGKYGRFSFFEVMTALAIYHFRKQNIDFAVLETGLGGRLDATNAINSIIAVLTPISLEHMHILGKTIGDITIEKAAIIKHQDQKVVVAPQFQESENIITERCAHFNIDPVWVDKKSRCELINEGVGGQTFDLSTEANQYEKLFLPLLGSHQRINCSVAVNVIECIKALGFKISTNAIYRGIKEVFWPLRYEIMDRRPVIILDGAHNAASVQATAELTKRLFSDKNIIIIFGISKDKEMKLILNELECITKNIIFTKADHPRSYDLPGWVRVKEAIELAGQKCDLDSIILVTGSLYVASEARRYIMEETICTN